MDDKKRGRKYDEAFLEYGFTSILVKNEEKPQCLICHKVLSSESMKPNKLKRHLETLHKEHVGKPVSFFKRRKEELSRQQVTFKRALSVPDRAQRASFEVSYRIAQAKKPHIIGETLVLPAAVDMVRIMCGEAEANKLKAIPLSNNTVKRRIEAIAANQENTLVERLKNTDAYALQVDMSTEGRDAHFLCFVRYIWEGAILEDILFCLPLPGHETAQEIFNVLHGYLKDNYIPFDRMVGFCTNGAPSVAGHRAGLRALVKIIAPSAAWTHCMIHREQLAAKDLSTELGEVLQQVTCIVNYIKAHPLRARLFAKLSEDMGSDHNLLLFHTEVRWLSRGRILERFFKLKEELLAYAIVCKKTEFSNVLSEQTKMCLLAYVTDIFGKLNELNTGMQGKNTNIFQLSDRITAFMKKITFWKTRLLQSNYESFPHLCKFLADNDNVQPPTQVIAEHLSRLNGQFASFFPDLDMSKYDWLQNPFQCNPDTVDLPAAEIEQLIEISCDRQLQGTYAQLTLSEFWFSVKNEYPVLSTRAMTRLVPFATTYLCEAGFSALVCIKSRYRSTLDVTSEIRCAISTTPPDFDKLCDNIQAHASH